MRVVISQPMYFPWAGLFDQMKHADIFIHYDDVQMPQGRSFLSRVQVKTAAGQSWLSVPFKHNGLQAINAVVPDETQHWREKHTATLRNVLGGAPWFNDALTIAENILRTPPPSLADLNIRAMQTIAAYLGFSPRFLRSSEMNIPGSATERLVDMVTSVGGTSYLTGHGARHYMDHERFGRHGVGVFYMDYHITPYPQKFGDFTPYVTILDLIAHTGPEAARHLNSTPVAWRDFMARFQTSADTAL